jgi:hypothetical protein
VRTNVTLLLAALDRYASNAVVDNQNQDGSCRGYEHAIQIKARNLTGAKEVEQVSAGQCANNSQNDVQKYAFSVSVDNLACEKPRNQSEKNPT